MAPTCIPMRTSDVNGMISRLRHMFDIMPVYIVELTSEGQAHIYIYIYIDTCSLTRQLTLSVIGHFGDACATASG